MSARALITSIEKPLKINCPIELKGSKKYEVFLPANFQLEKDHYEIACEELFMEARTTNFSQEDRIIKIERVFSHDYKDTERMNKFMGAFYIELPDIYYGSWTRFVQGVNGMLELNYRTSDLFFVYRFRNNKHRLVCLNKKHHYGEEVFFHVSPYVARLLNAPVMRISINDFPELKPNDLNIMNKRNYLYLESDAVEDVVIGDKVAPILMQTPLQNSDCNGSSYIYVQNNNKKEFKDLKKTTFNFITFNFKNIFGDRFQFQDGIANIALIIRKKRKM